MKLSDVPGLDGWTCGGAVHSFCTAMEWLFNPVNIVKTVLILTVQSLHGPRLQPVVTSALITRHVHPIYGMSLHVTTLLGHPRFSAASD